MKEAGELLGRVPLVPCPLLGVEVNTVEVVAHLYLNRYLIMSSNDRMK
jgi:hypothetical protein